MILFLYSCIAWMAQPLLRRKLARRGKAEPGYLRSIDERFGHYPPETDSLLPHSTMAAPIEPARAGSARSTLAEGGYVWVHAVSLGETRAAAVLVAELRAAIPGMRLLLTHGTATGRAEGERLLEPGDMQVWQPWDTIGAVRRFLIHFRPAIGVLMETEVWPNLVAGCRHHGVPLVLANARMNAASLARAQRLAWLARPSYAALTAVWAQSEADAQRLRQLGAPVHGVFGNLKFDAAPDAGQLSRGRAWRAALGRPVALLASARDGEEQQLADIFIRNRALAQVLPGQAAMQTGADHPPESTVGGVGPDATAAMQWLVVPRHPQRFEEVAQLFEAAGLTVARRSACGDNLQSMPAADVWLGDSLGEMALYYGLADVALLGGSFTPVGGQNLIEAAACGCPVVMGPSVFNFAEAAAWAAEAGAAVPVANMVAAVAVAQALTADPAAQATARDCAAQFAAGHSGAARRTAVAVVQLSTLS